MLVHPERIGALGLVIDKAVGRFPRDDFALPLKRNAAQAQPIVEQRAFFERCFAARQYFKSQPRRRDPLEIMRIGKETEHSYERLRKPQIRLELIGLHRINSETSSGLIA